MWSVAWTAKGTGERLQLGPCKKWLVGGSMGVAGGCRDWWWSGAVEGDSSG